MQLSTIDNQIGQTGARVRRRQGQPEAVEVPQRDQRVDQQTVSVPSQSQARQQAEQWQRVRGYDEPTASSQRALAAYQNVSQSGQREQIQAMFGVDLYA